MAENTTEDTKLSVNKNDMSETSSATSAPNKVVSSDREKEHADKASTSKEDVEVNNEKDKDSLDKEKQNVFKTDCNGDSKEETKSVSLEETEAELKENLKEVSSTEARSDNQEVLPDVDKRLNEILNVVHGDLQMEKLQKVANVSTTAKDSDEDDSGKDQQTVKKEDPAPTEEDNAMDSSKKYTASTALKSTEDERDSRSFSTKVEEKSEIGIVGSPTTISELMNEEELGGDSALSVDQKDHIVEWVENSVKVNADEENNISEECQPEMYEKDEMETMKRQKLDDARVISSRKSQKIVSNIIKKSIKWMPQCAVSSCRNSHRRTRKQSVRYHRFPHKQEVRELWVRACNRKPLTNGEAPFNINTARVCSRHFPPEFYEDESREQVMQGNQKRNRLRLGAVPTENVEVKVQPCFDLNESEKKRSPQTARLKVPNPKRVLLRLDEQKAANMKRGVEGPRGCKTEEAAGTAIETSSDTTTSNNGSSSTGSSNHCANEEEESDLKKVSKGVFLRALGLVTAEIPLSCLNRMHAMEGATEGRRRQVDTAEDEKPPKSSSSSSEIPQSQQNGAALPEETAAAPTATVSRVRPKRKAESSDTETPDTKSRQLLAGTSSSQQKAATPASGSNVTQQRHAKVASETVETKKRKSTNGQLSVNPRKKFCNEDEREEYISQIVGNDNETVDVLMVKADRLRADIAALENLAHAKEMEWNEILRKRKLKEEAYARLERKIHMTAYMENDGQLADPLPLATSSLESGEWDNSDNAISVSREKSFDSKEDLTGERSLDSLKREKTTKVSLQQRIIPPKTNGESNRKRNQTSPESRQIGEGRQGAIVDVRSIIADHRLKHPETVPRRGRRMRNSVNVGLGAGGAMVETGHNTDSRPSSTESCKSNPSTNDSMNYKDILVQFAKMSQQGEGTATKVPQNYPDVTLHPVAVPSSAAQNTGSQPTGSLLHGILTKAQSPRSTTFSPTLARLLTAPERERNPAATAAAVASMSQQNATTQHLLQTYQGSNLVSINDILSSSKARTEITITPVVNSSAQSHSNELIQVEDVEEETVIDDRKGSSSSGREGKQVVKDNPPSPSAPPKCQGCMIRPAQFVCAGCGNQWYCSRTCQLAAWATHSEYCSDYPLESENSSKIKSNV